MTDEDSKDYLALLAYILPTPNLCLIVYEKHQ